MREGKLAYPRDWMSSWEWSVLKQSIYKQQNQTQEDVGCIYVYLHTHIYVIIITKEKESIDLRMCGSTRGFWEKVPRKGLKGGEESDVIIFPLWTNLKIANHFSYLKRWAVSTPQCMIKG